MPNTDLTVMQDMVLEFICEYWRDEGRSPSYAEIASEFGWYTNNAREHVLALRKKGYIEDGYGRTRDIMPAGMREHIRTFHGKPVPMSND